METAEELLSSTTHRTFPYPKRNWKYCQQWHNTVFLHWMVSPSALEEFIPEGVQLDTYENEAWVSLVAFDVKEMHLRNLPYLPYVSHFYEINLRTYVTRKGKPGIYMFSIETDKQAVVWLTNWFIGLPYQKAKMKVQKKDVASENPANDQKLQLQLKNKGAKVEKSQRDIWLTERYCLYEQTNGKLYRFDIHHKKWKLKSPTVQIDTLQYKAGEFQLTPSPDSTHYCKKIKVLLWSRKEIKSKPGKKNP